MRLFGFTATEVPTEQVIKTAYKRLALKYHPDVHQRHCSVRDEEHREVVKQAFQAINQAMLLLLPDDEKRDEFNEFMQRAADLNAQLFELYVELIATNQEYIELLKQVCQEEELANLEMMTQEQGTERKARGDISQSSVLAVNTKSMMTRLIGHCWWMDCLRHRVILNPIQTMKV